MKKFVMAAIIGLVLSDPCLADSLQHTPQTHLELYYRAIFCDATFAATVPDRDFEAAIQFAAKYEITCPKKPEDTLVKPHPAEKKQ